MCINCYKLVLLFYFFHCVSVYLFTTAYDFSGFIDITSTAVLSTYLDLFLPTSSDNSQLSTVVMAVIIASAIVLVVVIVAMILCIVFSWHRKHSHGL